MNKWLPGWLASWLNIGAASAPAAPRAAPQPPVESGAASDPKAWSPATAAHFVAQLTDLTASLADEVQQHGGNVDAINAELSSAKPDDAPAVAAVVCKLLAMNQQTQHRLAQVELKLHAHARRLSDISGDKRIDPLTGLANRRAMDEALRCCLADFQRKRRPAVLLLLDLDLFKAFNDTHGLGVGDEALKQVADVLRTHARETDVVGRFGGEKFLVLFPGAPLHAVSQRAEKLRQSILARPIASGGLELHVSASGGLAELREGDDEQSWIQRAEAALEAARSNNRNCLFWHDGNQPQRFQPASESSWPESDTTSSDRRRAHLELAAETFSDPTFVSAVTRRIAEWRRGGATCAIVLARLDRADEVIRQHGHHAQQTALQALSQLACAALRDMDQSTRWTDDGLAILLPGAHASDAASVARRLLEAVEHFALPVGESTLRFSLSVGAAEVAEGNDAQRLLERAWQGAGCSGQSGGGQIRLHDGARPLPPPHHPAAV
jgi:diguanylate cyclase (GGDEF)-like protein